MRPTSLTNGVRACDTSTPGRNLDSARASDTAGPRGLEQHADSSPASKFAAVVSVIGADNGLSGRHLTRCGIPKREWNAMPSPDPESELAAVRRLVASSPPGNLSRAECRSILGAVAGAALRWPPARDAR